MARPLPEIRGIIVPWSARVQRLGDLFELSYDVKSEIDGEIESLSRTFDLLSYPSALERGS